MQHCMIMHPPSGGTVHGGILSEDASPKRASSEGKQPEGVSPDRIISSEVSPKDAWSECASLEGVSAEGMSSEDISPQDQAPVGNTA